jgi:hypothetical protein
MLMRPPVPSLTMADVGVTRPGVGLFTEVFGRGAPAGHIVMKLSAVADLSLTTFRNTEVAAAGTGGTPAMDRSTVWPGPSGPTWDTPMGP